MVVVVSKQLFPKLSPNKFHDAYNDLDREPPGLKYVGRALQWQGKEAMRLMRIEKAVRETQQKKFALPVKGEPADRELGDYIQLPYLLDADPTFEAKKMTVERMLVLLVKQLEDQSVKKGHEGQSPRLAMLKRRQSTQGQAGGVLDTKVVF